VAEAEIIARRRKWTAEQKAALLAEVEAEGGRVAIVARRHGLSESLLYNWRSAFGAGSSAGCPEAMRFVPLGVIDGPGERQPALLAAPEHMSGGHEPRSAHVGHIEIELPNGVRVRLAGSVNEKALSRVFRVLKGVM
jgi:transposase